MTGLGFVVVEWSNGIPGAKLTIYATRAAADRCALQCADREKASKWGKRYTVAAVAEVTP